MSEPENNGAKEPEDKAVTKENETREKIEKIAATALGTAKKASDIAMPYIKKGIKGSMSLIKAGIETGKQKLEERKKAAAAAKAAQPAAPTAPSASPVAPNATDAEKKETPKP